MMKVIVRVWVTIATLAALVAVIGAGIKWK
jgi:hypothetical protein